MFIEDDSGHEFAWGGDEKTGVHDLHRIYLTGPIVSPMMDLFGAVVSPSEGGYDRRWWRQWVVKVC